MNNLKKYQRRSIRLKDYDYSEPGDYFVTVCTNDFQCLFGEVIDCEMVLNRLGKIVQEEWLKTAEMRKNIESDEFIVMPNHIQGVITILETDDDFRRGVLQYAPTVRGFKSPTGNLGAIIRGFKSSTAKQINTIRRTPTQPVWQRNYYEHIIRNEKELDQIRDYIISNPGRWTEDKNNPKNFSKNYTSQNKILWE